MVTTRERILDTAVRLFNEAGTAAVSTNHIAAALGISPGNLYYHYRHKDAIIRAIFSRMAAAWSQVFTLPTEHPPTVADLQRVLHDNFAILWEYRFYYRELPTLMRHDPLLREQYQIVRRQGLTNTEELIRRFGRARVLDLPDDPHLVADLAQICWLIADFWLPFAELGDALIDSDHLHLGVNLIMRVLQPYRSPDDRSSSPTTPAPTGGIS